MNIIIDYNYNYNDIPSINSEEMKEIRKQEIKTDLEKLMLEKFLFSYFFHFFTINRRNIVIVIVIINNNVHN